MASTAPSVAAATVSACAFLAGPRTPKIVPGHAPHRSRMNYDKTALITGANKGIGYETARRLAELGMTVLVGARDRQRGEHALARLRERSPNVHLVILNVT